MSFSPAGPCVVLALLLVGASGAGGQEPARTPLEQSMGYYLTGSGKWRTPNPEYTAGSAQPREFGLDLRWGPQRHSIIGELIGVGERGRAVYATIFYVYNPVTHKVQISMASWDGTIGPAEERRIDETHRVIDAILYKPDGTVSPSQHVFEHVGPDEYRLTQLEWKGAGWTAVRVETWRQVAG